MEWRQVHALRTCLLSRRTRRTRRCCDNPRRELRERMRTRENPLSETSKQIKTHLKRPWLIFLHIHNCLYRISVCSWSCWITRRRTDLPDTHASQQNDKIETYSLLLFRVFGNRVGISESNWCSVPLPFFFAQLIIKCIANTAAPPLHA